MGESTPYRISFILWVLVVATVATVSSGSSAFPQQAAPQALQLETKIPLGNVKGRIDHMAVDMSRGRLFVAELGNNTVGVVDLGARKVIHRISGLSEPQGIAYVASNDSLYVANGGDGSVRIFRGADYALAGRIDLGDDADNIRFDTAANRLLVGYGKGAIAVIHLPGNSRGADLPLQAHPESFQFDPAKSRIFVNVPNARSIAVLDSHTGKQRANWAVKYAANFAMALDRDRQRLLVAFRHPAKFVAFSEETGAIAGEADTCGDADDLFLDRKRNRVYVVCGAGFLDVLTVQEPAYPRLARIPTVSGARTALYVAENDRLLLGVRARGGTPASIWVYRAVP